jgi:FkbH-like protein
MGHPVESTLVLAQWAPVLFAERPSRLELLKLKSSEPLALVTIRVHRNHSFEHIAAATGPWFAWWGREPQFLYSDYDDSLSFAFDDEARPDLELIWLDLQRYEDRFETTALVEWLSGRCTALRARTSAPIILATTNLDESVHAQIVAATKGLAGLRVADLRPVAEKLGARFFDIRAAKFSGTRLSDAACVLTARELSCHWAPALLRPRIKAVALDLDHTLYAGALGEDGDAVHLTPGHAALQRHLVALRERGIFLALVSRNEEADVRRLFENRRDFPLRWEHFSATAIGWGDKAEALRQAAQNLRIGVDAVLFVDDNPGELLAVASELPGIATAHAMPDATATQRELEYFPGLWAWERSATDALRTTDLEAGNIRAQLATQAIEQAEYLRVLEVRIRIEITPRDQLSRLHELSQKTNQFNLNLARHSEVELAQMLDAADHRIAAIGLQDRLSDSGLIGLVIAQRTGDTLTVRELAISCRALGRRLEDLMVAETVRAILAELPAPRVAFLHRSGPRNAPAREWLSRLTGEVPGPGGTVFAERALEKVAAFDYPVAVKTIRHEPK